jgi:hypothetical protein
MMVARLDGSENKMPKSLRTRIAEIHTNVHSSRIAGATRIPSGVT